ncbi:MAG TPA: hypothetical protein VF490_07220 [Chryseosolibacter sp.]
MRSTQEEIRQRIMEPGNANGWSMEEQAKDVEIAQVALRGYAGRPENYQHRAPPLLNCVLGSRMRTEGSAGFVKGL